MKQHIHLSPFDIAAETYDEDFTRSRIGQLQRKRVWQLLMPLLQSFERPLNILEINCGTGEDALALAQMGHKVIATDASEKMIIKANQKMAGALPAGGPLKFIHCSFSGLHNQGFEEPFDLVISNFGGLNCVDKKAIRALSQKLADLTTADGKLFLVVMGSSCLWEAAYYIMKGNFRKAFRRRQRSVSFRLKEQYMQVYYYAPGRLNKLFHPAFSFFQKYPVGLFIPPSYLETTFTKRAQLLKTLHRWENKFGWPALSFLADHYCLILNKKSPA
jgi:ubiquinone/menaquinone biosynthesis C-methylase UbiE